MRLTYERLDASELHGTTQADYLVSLEGDLQIIDDTECILDEPSFPVVELARSLIQWLEDSDRADFAFESMSFEEVGAVTIRRSDAGWVFSSVFKPGFTSPPLDWPEVARSIVHLWTASTPI